MTTMLAFHGDQAIKDKYIARVKAHREADRLIRGQGWENGRGCAVGCTLEAYDHSRYPVELGIPVSLATLEDWIFENLRHEDAMAWPERFLAAAKPGADLSLVRDRFAHWLLVDELAPLDSVHCRDMGALFARAIAGDEPKPEEWTAVSDRGWAARAAWDAAGYDSVKRQSDALVRLMGEAPVTS